MRFSSITFLSLLGIAACGSSKDISPAKPIISAPVVAVANSSVTAVASAGPNPVVSLDEPDSIVPTAEPTAVPMPPPTAAGRDEDLPSGARCRIGSMRLQTSTTFDAFFLGTDQIVAPSPSEWVVFDRVTGKWVESLAPDGVLLSISPKGNRAILSTQKKAVLIDPYSREHIVGPTDLGDLQWDTRYFLGQDGDDLTFVLQNKRDELSIYDRQLRLRANAKMPGRIISAALSANGKKLAVFGDRENDAYHGEDLVHVFDTSTGHELTPIPAQGQGFHTMALSPNGGLLVNGASGRLRLITLDSSAPDRFIDGLKDVHYLLFSPSGKRLFVEFFESQSRYTVTMLDVASGKRLWSHGGIRLPRGATFSPDGRSVILTHSTGLRIFDTLSGEERPKTGSLHQIQESAISPSGEKAIIESTGYLSWWSTRDCSLETLLPMPETHTSILVASADGTDVYSTNRWTLWKHSQHGSAKSVELRNAMGISQFALSPDGHFLAIPIENDATQPRKAQLLVVDAQTLEEKKRVPFPVKLAVESVQFSTDGRTLFVKGFNAMANGDSPSGNGAIVEFSTKNWAVIRSYSPKADEPDKSLIGAPPEWQKIIGEKQIGAQAALTCNKLSCLVLTLPKR
jgi:WD40 repeat protein